MLPLGAFVGTLVVQLPILAVLVLGLVLLSGPRRRLPGRAGVLARAGLAVILVETILGVLWAGLLPLYLSQATFRDGSLLRNIGLASASVQFLLGVLVATGLGLLLTALLTAHRSDPAPPSPFPAQPHPPPFAAQPHSPPSPTQAHPQPWMPESRPSPSTAAHDAPPPFAAGGHPPSRASPQPPP